MLPVGTYPESMSDIAKPCHLTLCLRCSTGEREQSRVQRLLLEGMMLVHEGSRSTTPQERALAETDEPFPVEAYGHLAATLRPMMVEAADERLIMLASNRFFVTVVWGFLLGAGGS